MGKAGRTYIPGADKTITTRLPSETVDALDALAADLGMSRYEIIRRMIEATLIDGTHRSPPLTRRRYDIGRPDKATLAAIAKAAKAYAGQDHQSTGDT